MLELVAKSETRCLRDKDERRPLTVKYDLNLGPFLGSLEDLQ